MSNVTPLNHSRIEAGDSVYYLEGSDLLGTLNSQPTIKHGLIYGNGDLLRYPDTIAVEHWHIQSDGKKHFVVSGQLFRNLFAPSDIEAIAAESIVGELYEKMTAEELVVNAHTNKLLVPVLGAIVLNRAYEAGVLQTQEL